MKCRKALLCKEEFLVRKERDKVCKSSKRASETCEQTLHKQEQNRTHLACAEGSALQCCSLYCKYVRIRGHVGFCVGTYKFGAFIVCHL